MCIKPTSTIWSGPNDQHQYSGIRDLTTYKQHKILSVPGANPSKYFVGQWEGVVKAETPRCLIPSIPQELILLWTPHPLIAQDTPLFSTLQKASFSGLLFHKKPDVWLLSQTSLCLTSSIFYNILLKNKFNQSKPLFSLAGAAFSISGLQILSSPWKGST